MDKLQQALESLVKDLDSVRNIIEVKYSGSTLSAPSTISLDAPFYQIENITFEIQCTVESHHGPQDLYNLVDRIRGRILGKRVVSFDQMISGFFEVASQYSGDDNNSKHTHTLVISCERPRYINQRIVGTT